MTIDYAFIKAAAKEDGKRITDYLALSPGRDPFYIQPAQRAMAEWFVERWRERGYSTGVHTRRVHYALVNLPKPPDRHDGRPYENTENCWDYICGGSLAARYCELLSSNAFIDRRNPDPEIYEVSCYDPQPEAGITGDSYWNEYELPSVPRLPGLPYGLPSLPCYEASTLPGQTEQPVLVCIWAEKTTQNDLLVPVCRKYGVNLITGMGEMSETACHRFLQRVQAAGKPARILYISDFDPAGAHMPVAVSRKVEWHQRSNPNFEDLDVRIDPIMLTAEQVAKYQLPRIPVKDSDRRKSRFEMTYGAGQVELDALEAIHPGEFARIVTDAVLQYRDLGLRDRTRKAYADFQDYLEEQTDAIRDEFMHSRGAIEAEYSMLREKWQALQSEFAALVEPFSARIEELTAEMNLIRDRGAGIHANALDVFQAGFEELDKYEPPLADLPDEPDGQLYDSRRDYWDQLAAYKRHKNGEQGRAAYA